jgi:hypothetical protein
MEELPPELRPRGENYFYKKHSDHTGFKVPPELQGLVDAQKCRTAEASRNGSTSDTPTEGEGNNPQLSVHSPQ